MCLCIIIDILRDNGCIVLVCVNTLKVLGILIIFTKGFDILIQNVMHVLNSWNPLEIKGPPIPSMIKT